MISIIRLLGKVKRYVALVIVLLIIQAYCDLELPAYTSDIMNVGIQQNGIEDAVPDQISAESLKTLQYLVSDEDAKKLADAYQPGKDGLLELKKGTDRESLQAILLLPESIVFQVYSLPYGKDIVKQIREAMDTGAMTREMLQAQLHEQMGDISGLSDMYLRQVAVEFVAEEYRDCDIELDEIRNAYLWKAGAKMLGISFIMMTVAVLTGLIAAVVSGRIGCELREQLYEKVMAFTGAEMEQFSTASLITRCTNDVQQVQMLIVMLLRMVTYAPILAIAGVLKVIKTGAGMSWTIVVAVIAIAILIAILLVVAYPKFRIMQSLVDHLNLVSREMLTGIMPIRAFGRQEHEEKRFEEANRDLYRTQLFTNRAMTFMMPIMMLVMNGVSILIVWVGGHQVDAGNVQVGDLTAFITYSMVIIMSFLMLSMISIVLPRASVAANRIMDVLNTEITLQDKEMTKDGELSGKGVLRFENVSFAYPGADENVLEHISFTAEPGQMTAIIGSTGCGKSTLINLIPRFYDVTGGCVTLDGVDIRDMSQEKLRDMIGLVPQKGMLFSGTIESNLKYAGESVSEEDMREAAAIAQAMEFIEAKEDGFDSAIAQEGSNVSGGQRQRLSIARAIAKHPSVYLFDDSFSALDYKTDAKLRKALAEKTKDATVLIVAQRIATIMHADKILVMDEGRLVGEGTHTELLKTCDVYLEIAKGQLSEAEIENAMKGAN